MLLSGTGTATLKASTWVEVQSGATLRTVDGAILIEGNRQATATAAATPGVLISGTVQSTDSGTITVRGTGGTNVSGATNGVALASGEILGGRVRSLWKVRAASAASMPTSV